MAGKSRKTSRAKRGRHGRTFSKAVSVFVIVLAAGYFLYKNVPQFKDFTDLQIAKAKTAAEKILGKNEKSNLRPANEADRTSSGNQEAPAKNEQSASDSRIIGSRTSDSEKDVSGKNAGQSKGKEAQAKKDSENNHQNNAKPGSANGLVALEKNLEIPLCFGSRHTADHERRNYEYYSICYRESYEQAEWSAYCLTREHLVKNASRSDDFRPDPEISTGSATLADYKGSGYDRGHLSPAADFSFDKNAMSETFYMSNMSPQAGGFNRGIWKNLEAKAREWAQKFGMVFIVSGPVLEKPAEDYESIGEDKVSVPQFYYKVLLAPVYEDENDAATPEDAKSVTAIGFIFPNEKCAGDIFDYAESIDEIEKRTGLDFFYKLDDTVENKIEAEVDTAKWK